jgi:hypothetical protein
LDERKYPGHDPTTRNRGVTEPYGTGVLRRQTSISTGHYKDVHHGLGNVAKLILWSQVKGVWKLLVIKQQMKNAAKASNPAEPCLSTTKAWC